MVKLKILKSGNIKLEIGKWLETTGASCHFIDISDNGIQNHKYGSEKMLLLEMGGNFL